MNDSVAELATTFINSLNARIDSLTADNAAKDAEIARLRGKLTFADRERDSFHELNETVGTVNQELKQQLAAVSVERDGLRQAASAWTALMTSIEAIHEAAVEDGATSDERLNGYIAAWEKQRDENTALRTELTALRAAAEGAKE